MANDESINFAKDLARIRANRDPQEFYKFCGETGYFPKDNLERELFEAYTAEFMLKNRIDNSKTSPKTHSPKKPQKTKNMPLYKLATLVESKLISEKEILGTIENKGTRYIQGVGNELQRFYKFPQGESIDRVIDGDEYSVDSASKLFLYYCKNKNTRIEVLGEKGLVAKVRVYSEPENCDIE